MSYNNTIWRLKAHHPNHCPGGCYLFGREPEHPSGAVHVPVDMFWGRAPWAWRVADHPGWDALEAYQ